MGSAALAPKRKQSKLEWIQLARLRVDSRLQRDLNESWCERRREDFNPDAIGTFIVSQREDGSMVLIDGQHRAHLLRLIGWGDQDVPCVVHRALSFADEARLFNQANDSRKVDFLTVFRNRVHAGDPTAVAITTICKEFGLKVANGPGEGFVNAARALQSVYAYRNGTHPKALRDTLRVVTTAWSKSRDSLAGDVIEGIGLVCLRDGAAMNLELFANKLAKSGTAASLIGRARTAKATHGGKVARSVAGVATDIYNRGLRVGVLESWW